MSKRNVRKYPSGPLTRRFDFQYVPGTQRWLTDEEVNARHPEGLDKLRPESLAYYARRWDPGEWAPETERQWRELLEALCGYYGVKSNDWLSLSIAMMFHHLPALNQQFKNRKAGRERTSPDRHTYWIDLYRTVRAEKGSAFTDTDIFRFMAKRAHVSGRNPEERVKGYIRRATQWLESEVSARRKEALAAEERVAQLEVRIQKAK